MRGPLDSQRRISKRTVLNVLGVVFLILLVAPFVVHTAPQVVNATGSYVVQSGSMEPAIQTGSVIFVYETDPKNIEKGDIIVYDLEGSSRTVTTHRVVEVIRDDGLTFRTKGDANEEPDPYTVPADRVIGVVPIIEPFGYPAQIPYMGHVLLFLNTKWGILAFVVVPAALLILTELYSLAVAVRRSRQADDSESPEADEPPFVFTDQEEEDVHD